MPADLVRRFAITHFFNPPRYMRLLEIVPPPGERSEAIEALAEFADLRLGKGVVVWAKDTPGFIANRIGVYLAAERGGRRGGRRASRWRRPMR